MYDGQIWLPPPEISISEWADTYRFLSKEASAEPGRWNTERAPYQREMMNAIKTCERIVIMSSAQVGKTEILLNTIGYYVDKDPSPILLIQPTLQMGEDFSKDRVDPMLRDTPVLSGLITQKARTRDNNILHKKFLNSAALTITGANSPASLASRPVRILLCDEVDRYPVSAGEEGDPLELAAKRTSNFWNRRIVLVSTPTLLRISRIAKAYEASTREEWCVPCPKCGEYQSYSWERIVVDNRIVPVMRCAVCGQEFSESEWKTGTGRWIAQAPEENRKVRGFHMNAFASPWTTWKSIVDSYYEAYAGGEEQLKVWTNTVLGEPYELREGTIDTENVISHSEDYADILSEKIQVLTCGVDVQDNRLECEVVGWGEFRESWGIRYEKFSGSPGASEVWEKLDNFLSQTWKKTDGSEIGISCTCIDSGGHFTDNVYRFVQTRTRRRIYAIVGRGTFGHPSVSGPSRNNRRKVPLFILGVSTIKGLLFSYLQAEKGEGGYCHFPAKDRCGYDTVYYKGLLSERMIIKQRNGREYILWEKKQGIARNEPPRLQGLCNWSPRNS